MDKQQLAELADKVKAFLDGFATAKEFLKACDDRGIKAMPEDPCECAVALLIKSQFPELFGFANVEVLPALILSRGGEFTLRLDKWPDSFEKRPLSDPAVRFAKNFDAGDYLSIITEEHYEDDEDET